VRVRSLSNAGSKPNSGRLIRHTCTALKCPGSQDERCFLDILASLPLDPSSSIGTVLKEARQNGFFVLGCKDCRHVPFFAAPPILQS
jgi:hypothetical protein